MATFAERLTAWAALSPLGWAKRYTPAAVPAKYAEFHRQLVELPKPGHAQARAVFRGAAKTTLSRATVAWAAERRKVRGVVLVRATGSDCKADRQSLERVCRQRGLPYTVDHELRLIVINRVPVWTVTPGGAVRGIQWTDPETGEVIRPNLAIIDDLETRDSARSKYQTGTIQTWLFSDLLATADQEHPMSVIMWGTPITPTCLMAKAMRREKPFDKWDPPLVVPIVDADGVPAWPATFRPELLEQIPAITKATEYDLQPLPEGTLLFPPSDTVWLPGSPQSANVVVSVDPAGDGEDATGIAALCMTPRGLHLVDAVKYDGPRVGMPDAVWRFCNSLAGHRITQVAVEAVGGWEFAADAIASKVDPIYVTREAPRESKVERALRLTNWHTAGAFTVDAKLRGSDWDVEFHSFTQEGMTITAHDDMTDSTVWGAAILTSAWSVQPPAKRVA